MRRKKDKSNGITALYERLSRDDDNAGESNSIVHQKQMLEDYAMKHGFTNLVHFTDDGWSGATFDRPSWNRLVEGVKNGEITACICKDMSRIGRDHLQVGFFTDILFREKEVRFIAINNGIDSDRQETSEFAPFLNIMNEWFVRDTSKKIKAVLKSRGSSGNAHTSNIPPYGYLKDPENPDHWIIDEEAAEVVRRIYRMTIEGKGPYQIARELSEEKIERPSYYLGKKGLGNHASNYDKENPYMWRGNQVTTLIARPEYIGKTVNFRTFKNSYKDKKTKRADKEDWVVFDDTQEPIVDEETWLLAQKLRQNVRKADPMGEPNVLTGKIYCADCGAPMYNHRERKGRERIYYTAKGEKRTSYSNPADCYECSTYNLGRQKYDRHCTCHHISTKALKSIILKTIQETCHYVSLNEQEFVYSLQEESAMKDIAVSETVKKRIERNQKRLHELDMLIRKIYEDNVIGRLSDRLFQSMSTLFTYDMLRDIWVPLLSGIIGGLFTLIGVILTIKHERKKDISEHLQEIKPYLVIVHPSEVKRSEWNSQRYIYMLDDENDFDEDDVSTPLYRWDYLCLSNIGSSIGILKYIKVNEDIYSFDENSAIRPDECYQIHGSRLTNFTSGHVNSIHLGLYDKCFNFYEYNISFSIKELAPRDHPRENEKLLHFDTIDCVHNLYRPKQSFIGSFFHHRF